MFTVKQAKSELPTRPKTFTQYLLCCSMLAVLTLFSTPVLAAEPRGLSGSAGDAVDPVIPSPTIWNRLLVPPPPSSLAADVVDAGRVQEAPGRGISEQNTPLGMGIALSPTTTSCNDFNQAARWHGPSANGSVNWYAGWAPFAVDQGYFRSQHVIFAQERVVGPGQHTGNGQYSAKIAGNQPYAAGFGSPLIAVTPGATITVSVSYLIWDHDDRGLDYDWASLGVKPDASASPAYYANGYTRGQWAELTQIVHAGPSGRIMVLLQASSPGALNSNIFFDNVQIAVDGQYLADCLAG